MKKEGRREGRGWRREGKEKNHVKGSCDMAHSIL